jgi:hypothetical protein
VKSSHRQSNLAARSASALVEPLEVRCLLSWGAAPHLINQDLAASDFPTITGKGVSVAVMDTGVDYNSPLLGGGFGPGHKVIAGHDFVDNDSDPMDTFGHGTEVAGVIAANQFQINGQTYQGIAPGANIVALRVSNGSDPVTDATILSALQWIEQNYKTYNIASVNFSFGAGSFTGDETHAGVSTEYKKLSDLGILFVSPTGNGGTSDGQGINWPAADPSVTAVGSVGTSDQISDFTQRGSNLDLLAPGENVGTTMKGGTTGLVTLSSFSSPAVAGAAALLKQVDPFLKGQDELSILRASGVEHIDTTFGSRQFYPRINLESAIALAYHRAVDLNSDVGTSNGSTSSDLAYDAQGVLHFAYYDQAMHTIKYATRDTSGLWSATQLIDKSGDDVGATLSLALDPSGQPAVAYYDATFGDLIYSRFDGLKWRRADLDSKNIGGQFPSLAFDNNGNPVVAYYRKTSGDLRVMRLESSLWTRSEADTTGDVGQFASLAVAKDGTIAVAYADGTNGDLKYAQLSGSTWSTQTLDDLRGTAFISLAFNSSSQPAISYYDAFPADLKFATKASGSWQTSTVTHKGAVGLFTNLWFDKNNSAEIVYYNRKSDGVFRIWGSPASWSAQTLRLGGGTNAVATPTLDGSAATYVFWFPIKAKLWTGEIMV